MLSLPHWHHIHCRPVTQHLGHTLRNLSCIISHPNQSIGACLLGMLKHQFVGIVACLLAKLRVNRNVASHKLLKCSSNVTDNAAGADDDTPYDTKVSDDTITTQFKGSCHQTMIHDTFLLI